MCFEYEALHLIVPACNQAKPLRTKVTFESKMCYYGNENTGVWPPHNLSTLITFSPMPGSIKACNEQHCPYHTHMTAFIAMTPGQALLASVLFFLQNILRLC